MKKTILVAYLTVLVVAVLEAQNFRTEFEALTFTNSPIRANSQFLDTTFASFHKEIKLTELVFMYVPANAHRSDTSKQEKKEPKVKKLPKQGFQFGLTQHELVLTSANLCYLTKKHIGLEASARVSYELGDENYKFTTAYLGAVYQLRRSRYFLKGGIEIVYDINDELDELRRNSAVFLGGKYLLPLTNWIAIQLDVGVYYSWKPNLPDVFPGLGLGFAFGSNK